MNTVTVPQGFPGGEMQEHELAVGQTDGSFG
jgi:hypothetical protein